MKVLAFILTTVLVALPSIRAATNPPPNSARAAASQAQGRGLPFHGTVAAVDKSGKTITMQGKKQRVFHIIPETKINKDDSKSSFNAVVPGVLVGGYAREMPDGTLNLVTLNIHSTPAKPAKPAK
jgi:hypothetical protein